MQTSLPYSPSEHRATLALNKSTIIVWVAISLVLVETFSGAMRFYLDQVGASALMYVPKAACFALFILELPHFRASRGFWLGLLMLLTSGVLAMLHGASLGNVGFALFMYSPLLFGLVCGEHLEHRKRLLGLIIGLCLVASLVGAGLDMFTQVPWKGYSYTLGDTELSGNTAWSAGGADRIAGFTRMSTSLSVLIAIYALYLAAFTRSRLLLAGLFCVAIVGIYVSTNKSTVAAFICTLLMLPFLRQRMTCRALFFGAVAMGLALPIIGLTMNFDPRLASAYSDSSLASLYDRLINTWPMVVHSVHQQGWSLFGSGFGMVGSSVLLFPVYSADTQAVCDNTAVYLWAAFGAVGVVLYALQLPLLIALREKTSWMGRALLSICFCIALVSWTTDVLEIPIADLFIGLAIAHVLRRKALPSTGMPERRKINRNPNDPAPDRRNPNGRNPYLPSFKTL
ncbi:MAG: hypothetical protein PW845_16765 [Pseudomonas sp.]|uniref:hypothetical protein n=1 Tax=Pseudomonas abieticivorans TaxID=2931382 RepID=UPI0020BF5EA9|nr:hypothetical protein [Pseudomonas sp. PIA16]MDE1166977.1 hypothetical protein [Pseudomonas sp.]